MRLINTGTLHMHQFFHGTIPGYAILSHTWFDDEVTFQEWRQVEKKKNKRPKSSESVKEIERKAGYRKVVEFCTTCSRHPYNLEWAWIDTCCIDKTSSSELSEAINSMFNYYTRAKVCYIYLSDVSYQVQNKAEPWQNDSLHNQLKQSRWFTRGWTL